MYHAIYQPTRTTLVIITGGEVSDKEWQNLYDDLIRATNDCVRLGTELIILAISQKDTKRPNANWRRKFAELRPKQKDVKHVIVALVVQSLFMKGIMTAINWVIPAQSKEKINSFDTPTEAIAWLELQVGRPSPYLQEMHLQLLQELKTTGKAV